MLAATASELMHSLLVLCLCHVQQPVLYRWQSAASEPVSFARPWALAAHSPPLVSAHPRPAAPRLPQVLQGLVPRPAGQPHDGSAGAVADSAAGARCGPGDGTCPVSLQVANPQPVLPGPWGPQNGAQLHALSGTVHGE